MGEVRNVIDVFTNTDSVSTEIRMKQNEGGSGWEAAVLQETICIFDASTASVVAGPIALAWYHSLCGT